MKNRIKLVDTVNVTADTPTIVEAIHLVNMDDVAHVVMMRRLPAEAPRYFGKVTLLMRNGKEVDVHAHDMLTFHELVMTVGTGWGYFPPSDLLSWLERP